MSDQPEWIRLQPDAWSRRDLIDALAEAKAERDHLREAAKRVLEADMRGVRDLDALNALEDAAGFWQQGQRRGSLDAQAERDQLQTENLELTARLAGAQAGQAGMKAERDRLREVVDEIESEYPDIVDRAVRTVLSRRGSL